MDNGEYPLHLLCKNYTQRNCDVVLEMIEAVKRVGQCSTISEPNQESGYLPLHYMCESGETNTVKVIQSLLPCTSNLNATTILNKNTALHLACIICEKHDVIKLLAGQGPLIDVSVTNMIMVICRYT